MLKKKSDIFVLIRALFLTVLWQQAFEGSWKLSEYHFISFCEKINQFQAS